MWMMIVLYHRGHVAIPHRHLGSTYPSGHAASILQLRTRAQYFFYNGLV
jgi:hypothetical protein